MKLYERQTILQELGKDEFAFVLLSVGELSSHKNQETVIKALGKLQRTDIVYLIAGTGNLENKFQRLIKEYGLEKQVFLLGQRKDIGSLCDLADVFVHVSVREGLGMAPLEAMAKGMPLLSSYVNGIKDYTLDGVTGICVTHPKNVEEVALAIVTMISNSGEWCDYSAVNRAITKQYSNEKSKTRMREIYKREVKYVEPTRHSGVSVSQI